MQHVENSIETSKNRLRDSYSFNLVLSSTLLNNKLSYLHSPPALAFTFHFPAFNSFYFKGISTSTS